VRQTIYEKGLHPDMVVVLFDVNDDKLRNKFFAQLLAECMACLDENTPPLWGKMTSQHMIEHLLWAFECSTGTIELPCRTPEHMLERVKTFLHNNTPMSHDFKNPLLGKHPLPFRFNNFVDAKNALLKETVRFVDHFHEQPTAIHVHPIFGPLGAEEWQRAQFKHCYHHLLQFGLLQ
jgi:oxepin-CoA hydrolase/3-oxo-5,6-dehydrosuberyl-CoA semialdehyde dehydrogenase